MTFPCMRCGEKPKLGMCESLFKIECKNCDVAVVMGSDDEAIGSWNRRYGEVRGRIPTDGYEDATRKLFEAYSFWVKTGSCPTEAIPALLEWALEIDRVQQGARP